MEDMNIFIYLITVELNFVRDWGQEKEVWWCPRLRQGMELLL